MLTMAAGCHWTEDGAGHDDGAGAGAGDSRPVAADPHAEHRKSTLKTATVPGLGEVITDTAGQALYRFEKDSPKPSASACEGECLKQWPPVTAPENITVYKLDSALVGKIKRPDGIEQVTFAGWPLYRHSGDSAPGQTNGQGKNEAWFVVDTEGEKAQGGVRSEGYGG